MEAPRKSRGFSFFSTTILMQHTFSNKKFLACIVVLCLLAYARGLVGGFVLDDFPAIVNNPALRNPGNSLQHWLTLAFSSSSGILRRPISMLSFGFDNALFGLSPFAFKTVNLLLHFLNGVLFFLIARRITPRLTCSTIEQASPDAIALFATAIWIAHPIHVSSVLYVVQRMNLLSTLFCLVGLLAYVEGRMRVERGERGLVLALGGPILALPFAILSKENGALLFAYALVIEFLCFRFAAPKRIQRVATEGFFILTIGLPLALLFVYLTMHPQWLIAGYADRDFTLAERLMSETRILTDYLTWIFLPLPKWMGIFHDDFVKSTCLLQPRSTLFCILFWMALITIALIYRRTKPGFTFAVLWFLMGHAMESTILPLELVFDHRNYLPMAGFLLGVACWLGPKIVAIGPQRLTTGICAATLLALVSITAVRAYDWSSEMRLAQSELDHHPESSRAQYLMGQEIIFAGTAAGEQSKAEQEALPYFERVKTTDSTDIYSACSAFIIMGRDGKELPADAIDDLARRVKSELRGDINPFLTVLKAAADGVLHIDKVKMEKLVYSALENPMFTHSVRAAILSNFAHYQFQRLHDTQAAVGLALAATVEDPTNPIFQMDVTQLAIALGNLQEARKHLELAKQLNKAGLYDRALQDLASQLPRLNQPQ